MKRILYKIVIVLFCTVIWLVLNENFSIYHIAIGAVLGFISLYITNGILYFDGYNKIFDGNEKIKHIRPLLFPKYLLFLLFQIYLSGFTTIAKIITGDLHPDIVEIESKVDNDLYVCILANSITLTPGTVTIEKNNNNLKVLWGNKVTQDKEKAGELIKGRLEKILRKD